MPWGDPAVLEMCTLHMNGRGDRGDDHSHQSGQETVCLVGNTDRSVTCLQAEHVLWEADMRRTAALSRKGVLESNFSKCCLFSLTWGVPGHLPLVTDTRL